MTFPESTRVVYAADTLVEVACQLNFPPVLAIGAETPVALQDRLREEYPFYDTVQPLGAPPQIAALLQRLPNQPSQPVQHKFTSADGERTITVGPQLLAITTSNYGEWPVFLAAIEAARAAVEDIYRPAFYTRVGLRYQDVIDRKEIGVEVAWSDLIAPTLLGLFGASELQIREAVRESGANVMLELDGADAAFVHINHGLAQREDSDERVYLIDADYFTGQRREGAEVNGLLGYFNAEAGRLFRWAITDTLRDALGAATTSFVPRTDIGGFGFETCLVGRTYRVDFTSDDIEPETLLRAFGCALMSLMPDSGLDDAVQAVCDALQFALDDASLLPAAPTETIRTGIASHVLPVVEWDRP